MKLPKNFPLFIMAGAAVVLGLKLAFLGGFSFKVTLIQVGMIVSATISGFSLGWLCSPGAKLARRWIVIAFILLVTLVALGNPSPLGMGYGALTASIAFFMAFSYWFGGAVKRFMEKPTTFGSAEWATLPYLEANGLVGTKGFRLGEFRTADKIAPLHYHSDRHLLTIAPTRSGKGTSAIIPNLLTYTGSVLVIDPKGENALITASQRAQMSSEIHVVDPWGIASGGKSSRFNPIDWLRMDDPDITENAMLLADALVVPDGSGERFWIEEAKALLQGLILYVATSEHEEGRRTLPRVRDLLLLDGDGMKELWQRMLEADHHIVASTGARSLQKEDKVLASVIASAQAQTHFLDSARLRENLSSSDFEFEDLKLKPMSIYLVLPADRLNTFSRWLRLLIQQAITVNARNIQLRPDKPILFVLDELPALGHLRTVEQAFGLMAGFGMQLWGISQDLAQLKKVYGEGGYESLISNSGVIQYFGSRDELTANYFSALCGVTTVWNFSTAFARSFSSSHSNGDGKSSTSSSSSTSTTNTSAVVQRKLAFADELMRLPAHSQLIFVENHHPIIGTKVRWHDDPVLKTLGRNLHRR